MNTLCVAHPCAHAHVAAGPPMELSVFDVGKERCLSIWGGPSSCCRACVSACRTQIHANSDKYPKEPRSAVGSLATNSGANMMTAMCPCVWDIGYSVRTKIYHLLCPVVARPCAFISSSYRTRECTEARILDDTTAQIRRGTRIGLPHSRSAPLHSRNLLTRNLLGRRGQYECN